MATLHEILPEIAALEALQPEELAGIVLELIRSHDPNSAPRLHPSSISNPTTLGPFPHPERDRAAFLVTEGWQWLVNEGFLAPKPGETSGWHFITRRGEKVPDRVGLAAYVSSVILPKRLVHPAVLTACWPAFLRGEYDTAVFQAYRETEVSIRKAGEYGATDYGSDLARRAFDPKNGPLTDPSKPLAEREALAHLVAGALGSYKNPHSHRRVSLSSDEAVEMILLASHIVKIVDSRTPTNAP